MSFTGPFVLGEPSTGDLTFTGKVSLDGQSALQVQQITVAFQTPISIDSDLMPGGDGAGILEGTTEITAALSVTGALLSLEFDPQTNLDGGTIEVGDQNTVLVSDSGGLAVTDGGLVTVDAGRDFQPRWHHDSRLGGCLR